MLVFHPLLDVLCPSSTLRHCHLQHQLALGLPRPWVLIGLHLLNIPSLERHRLAVHGRRARYCTNCPFSAAC